MKTTLVALSAAIVTAGSVQAGLIAHYGFDAYTAGTPTPTYAAYATAFTYSAGSGSASAQGATGTALNDPRSPAGPTTANASAFRIAGALNDMNAASFTIAITPTASLSDISVSYAGKRVGGGGAVNTWSYSFNNSAFTQITNPSLQAPNNTFGTLSFTVPATVNANQTLYIRMDIDGASGSGTAQDFDNIQINAVPEPTNVALTVFGIGAISIAAARRIVSREQHAA